MSSSQWLRWVLFTAYILLVPIIPLTLLWELKGLLAALSLATGALIWLRFSGMKRLEHYLDVHPLSPAESGPLHAIAREYARRLGVPTPRLAVIENNTINIALFGFNQKETCLALTRGALVHLSRDEKLSVIARAMVVVKSGTVPLATWLAQFLIGADKFAIEASEARGRTRSRHFYSFRALMRRTLIYPLTLFPLLLLRAGEHPEKLDEKAAKLCGKPRALSEVHRMVEARSAREPMRVRFSLRHLFSYPPHSGDPVVRVLFEEPPLTARLRALEKMQHSVVPV